MDNPSIGLVLCKYKNDLIVEWALRDANKPMGVAHYLLSRGQLLPKHLEDQLPTAEEIALELPLLDLVKARIDVEGRLLQLANEQGIKFRSPSGSMMIRELELAGVLPVPAEELWFAFQTMSLAIHGQPVDPETAQTAIDTAHRFTAAGSNVAG